MTDAPAKKRSKTTPAIKTDAPPKKRAPRSRKGPDRLENVPDDVLIEILKECEPLALLQMSRVNKRLCGILLVASATAQGIWVNARANLKYMPAPFEGMSEAAWAQFLLVNKCSYCLKGIVRKFEVQLKVRVCKACASDDNGLVCDRPTIGYILQTCGISSIPRHDFFVALFEVSCIIGKDARALQKDVDELKSKLMRVSSSKRKTAFDDHCEAFMLERQHTFVVETWLRTKDRSSETFRITVALEKLKELGYGEEVDMYETLGLGMRWMTTLGGLGKTLDPEKSWVQMKAKALVLADEARELLVLRNILLAESGLDEKAFNDMMYQQDLERMRGG